MADVSNTVEIKLTAKDEASSVFAKVNSSLDGMKSRMVGIGSIAAGGILAGLGLDGISAFAGGIKDLATGMISANAQMEVAQQKFTILYGSATQAAQAMAFLRQNELSVPFDISDIVGASTQLVAFRQNITQVIPALENIAGAMGDTVSHAADAFTAALAGRFQMLRQLGISRQMLIDAGAQINAGGHLTDPNSLATAIMNLADTKFKDGAAKLSNTWQGLMSNLRSQWTYFEMNLGGGVFSQLEGQLKGLVGQLRGADNPLQQFAKVLGEGIGRATAYTIQFAQTIGPYLGSAIVGATRAWGAFQGGLKTIGDNLGTFGTFLRNEIPGVLNGMQAAFTTVMPIVTKNWAAGLDLLSGNWAKFQADVNQGATYIAGLLVDLFAGIEESFGYQIGTALMGPWTKLAQGVRTVFDGIGVLLGALVGTVTLAFADIDAVIIGGLNKVLQGVGSVIAKLPGFLHFGITDSQLKAMQQGAPLGTIDPIKAAVSAMGGVEGWFNKNAPGINTGQTITPGVTQAQFIADLEKRRKQILDQLGLNTAPGGTPYYNPGGGKGGSILDILKQMFTGLGGKLTWKEFLADMGFSGVTAPGLGAAPNLDMGGYAAVAANAAAAGSTAALKQTTGRVPLGNLGVQFMQSAATTGRLHAGTDPATAAAQQQVTQGQTAATQRQTQITTLQRLVDGQGQMITRLETLISTLGRGTAPQPTPVNPLVHHGVFRPAV